MSWSLGLSSVSQGDVRAALEAERDRAAEAAGGYSSEVADQQDAAFAGVETTVDKAEFHGGKVSVSVSGHVAQAAGESDSVYVTITGQPREAS